MDFVVPEWLAERNRASWREVLAFYEELASTSDRCAVTLRLVRRLAGSNYAEAFRAGTSLAVLMISTAVRHGLRTGESYVAISAGNGGSRLCVEYCNTASDEALEQRTCEEADLLACLQPMLVRLWDARPSEHEYMKQFAMEGDPTITITTKVAGRVRFEEMVQGLTLSTEKDTDGAEHYVIPEHSGDLHPQIVIEDEMGSTLARHYLPEKARLVVRDGQWVQADSLLATRPADRST